MMQANVGRETKPERTIRTALRAARLTFKTNTRPVAALPCRADFAFGRERVCVFIDGCFWHGCPRHFAVPHTNAAWWDEKVRENAVRDRRQRRRLRQHGWSVLRVWEHDVDRIERVVGRIRRILTARRPTLRRRRKPAD